MSSNSAQHAPTPTSTNMTVLVISDQDPASPPVEEEKTATGIPITLIWLPYVCFSIFLVALMCLSFIHYHKKNGHKYRRRQAALLKQFNMQDILTQFQGSSPPNGGFTVSTENPPLTPQPQVNPFHHRSPKQNPHFQPNAKNTNEDLYPTRRKQPIDEPIQKQPFLMRQFSVPSRQQPQPAYSPRGVPLVATQPKSAPQLQQQQPSTSNIKYRSYYDSANIIQEEGDGGGNPQPPDKSHERNRSSSERGSGGTSEGSSHSRRQKRPLTFTSNLNGSMVDVRCGVTDSHKTFRTKNNRSTSLPNSSVWTLPPLSSASHAHHQQPPYSYDYSNLPPGVGGRDYDPAQGVPFSPSGGALHSIMSDCEDDEAFLLQQTKL